MKTCSKCKIDKEITEFCKSKLGKNGLSARCRNCANHYYLNNKEKIDSQNKQYCLNNKEKLKDYNKQYHLDNKDKHAKQMKQWRLDNKEKTSKRQKQWRLDNKEKIIQTKKQYYLDNTEKIKQYRLDNKEKLKQYRLDNKEKLKQYRLDNKESILIKNKESYLKNKVDISRRQKEYYLKNRLKTIERQKQYVSKNKQKINSNKKARRQTDSLYKLRYNISNLIRAHIKKQGYSKTSKTQQILGCDFETFKAHLEKQFTKGMNWSNQGEWHLDHIYPVSLARDEKHLIELNHYTNFQPLWALDNIKKGNKIQEKQLFLI